MQPTTTSQGRPYRSHKVPACQICRTRKIHCNVDVPSQPCRFCREHGLHCQVSATKHEKTSTEPATKRRKPTQPNVYGASHEDNHDKLNEVAESAVSATITSPIEPASVMVNPPLAEDIDVLERYLTSRDPTAKSPERVSHHAGDSIVYVPVPKGRTGFPAARDPGRGQREIMDQVLYPYQEEVLKLYFTNIQPCFPILDELTFWEVWRKDPKRISSTLLCDIYAVALLFWQRSPRLREVAQPDAAFMWNQAVAALQEEFMTPSTTTISAALLDLSGRPSVQMMNNIGNAGRVVALSHSLGLHRNPTAWKMAVAEKQLRIGLWWAVLVHDHWSSLAHGTPPHVRLEFYDVPLPLMDSPGASYAHKESSMCFVSLCSLTQIQGELLPLVYSLKPAATDMERSLRRIECQLDEWEDGLPTCLKSKSADAGNVNGRSNLWFCYLNTRLLLARVAFRTASQAQPEVRDSKLALLRDSACNFANFVTALQEEHLAEFWLPYTAHLLVSATTTLLRCTVETTRPEAKTKCANILSRLIDRLQNAHDVHKWDLAEFCLRRCGESIRRVVAMVAEHGKGPVEVQQVETEIAGITADETLSTSWDDLFGPVDSLDLPWDPLWDSFDGSWMSFT